MSRLVRRWIVRFLAVVFAVAVALAPVPVASASMIHENGMTVVYGDPCFRDYKPTDFMVSPDGSKVFVFSSGPVMCVIDATSMKAQAISLPGQIPLGRKSLYYSNVFQQPVFTVDGSRLFIRPFALSSGGTGLMSIDVHSLSIHEYPLSGSFMMPGPDGKKLYSARRNSGALAMGQRVIGQGATDWEIIVVDAGTGRQLSETAIRLDTQASQKIQYAGVQPVILSVSRNARYLYARSNGNVLSIDLSSGVTKIIAECDRKPLVSRDARFMFLIDSSSTGAEVKRVTLDTGAVTAVTGNGSDAGLMKGRRVWDVFDDGSIVRISDDAGPTQYDEGKSIFDMREKRFIPSMVHDAAATVADYITPDGKLMVSVEADESDRESDTGWQKPWNGIARLYAGAVGAKRPSAKRTLDFGRLPLRLFEPSMKFSPDGKSMFFLAAADHSADSDGGTNVDSGCKIVNDDGTMWREDCYTPSGRDEGVFARASVDWLTGRDSSRRQPEGSSVSSWGIYVVLALLVALAAGVGALTVWYRRG